MSVTVQRDALLTVVRQVSETVQPKHHIPILANVLIEIGDGMARLTGTDLDCQVRAECEAQGALATTVSAAKLAAALGSLKPGNITVAHDAARMTVAIKQGRSTRTMPTQSADDFPIMPAIDEAHRFHIDAAVLRRLIESAAIAQATDDAQAHLNGVYLHVHGDQLCAVGLDRLRMVVAAAPIPAGAEDIPGMIIPARAIGMIRKLLLSGDEPIVIEASDLRVTLSAGSLSIVAKLIDGTYTDYRRLIPAGSGHKIRAGRTALVDAVAATAAVVDGDGKTKVRTVRVEAQPGGEPELSARDSVGSASVEPLPASYEGEGIVFGVNSRLLISIAEAFREASKLQIELVNSEIPLRVTSEAEPDLIAICGVNRV